MNSIDFPLELYLDRIGLDRAPQADEKGLEEIHSAQVFSIPFENLDIHLGLGISLAPGDLIYKILHQRRGGYCFELNGIFRLALNALGFLARPALARVLYGRTNPGPRTHEVVIVTISGRKWLADVGFGGPGLRLPVPMTEGTIFDQYGDCYCLRRDPESGIVLQKAGRKAFFDLYAFDENELTLDVDIEMSNHFTSTWPESKFKLHRMCALSKPWGRITLSDMKLITYRNGQRASRILPPGPEYMEALTDNFGIVTDADYDDFAPLSQPLKLKMES